MSTYNGWTNYATWRINLEIFDGMGAGDFYGVSDVEDLEQYLNSYAHDYITENSTGLAQDYALAFLDGVNFQEIAEHLADDNELFTTEDDDNE